MSATPRSIPPGTPAALTRRSLRASQSPPIEAEAPQKSHTISRVRPGQLTVGIAIDLVAGLVCVLACVSSFASGGKTVGAVSLVAVIIAAGLQFASWATRGQTLGWAAAGIRQVTEADGAPLGLSRLLPPQPSWLADIRKGHDPIAPTLSLPALLPYPRFGRASESWTPAFTVPPMPAATSTLAEQTVAAAPPNQVREAHPELSSDIEETRLREDRPEIRRLLVIDGNARHALGARVLVGRSPSADAGETAVSVADLSRLMSKTHLLLENSAEGRLFVTDLGSTNGTRLETTGSATPLRLPAHTRTELDTSSVLRIGEHTLAFATPGRTSGMHGGA